MTLLDPEASAAPIGCSCEACKYVRFEPSKLRGALVHRYSYRPAWTPRSVPNDPHSYYLGVELETALPAYNSRKRYVDRPTVASMKLPKTLWVVKEDGSVTGPEFVSQPATLAYWKRQKPALTEMFRNLLHAGVRSHDGDTCGMHVNIDRGAFDDGNHLYRFVQFVYGSPAWTRKMGQRTKRSSERWASLEHSGLKTAKGRKRFCAAVAGRNGSPLGRYVALNAPAGEGRFEFRVPRGTLRIDRFYKNLEWVVAMIEFTRNADVADCFYRNQFYKWVGAREDEYPNLVSFLEEWFPQYGTEG